MYSLRVFLEAAEFHTNNLRRDTKGDGEMKGTFRTNKSGETGLMK